MPLAIETFNNTRGGSTVFKALGHPLAAAKGRALVARLAASGPVALYDPDGHAETLHALYPLTDIAIHGVYVQSIEDLGQTRLGHPVHPVTDLAEAPVRLVLIIGFDTARQAAHIAPYLPSGADVVSLDAMRIPDDLLTDRRDYLSRLNFATNLAFLRDDAGQHTRVVTANYWSAYGAQNPLLWLCLFDGDGSILATWTDPLPCVNGVVTIDSAHVRQRFDLGAFTGTLYMHVVGAAGHDIVKYALDTYGDDDTILSCTHDANAWPSNLYAGLPAPRLGERVLLWVQNSHPCPIPPRGIGLNRMGDPAVTWIDQEIGPFGTAAIDVGTVLPGLQWPNQVEIQAGKHFVRPRYEVVEDGGRRWIAHANVQRTDLVADQHLADIDNLMGKGFILPAPVLPTDRYRTTLLPTPMSTAQAHLPIQAIVYDSAGHERARHAFGNLARSDSVALDVSALLTHSGADLTGGFGHVELVYDFAVGDCADGWLHAIFRYHDSETGHSAETSFGSHIFNTVLVYKSEPQSYAGRPPGLSTRLFLRLGPPPWDTVCHLIYPASTPWHPYSRTQLSLTRADGSEVANRDMAIPCGGSYRFVYSQVFTPEERAAAGDRAYVLIRDTTCRLFGYHGCTTSKAFSFDHMFGF